MTLQDKIVKAYGLVGNTTARALLMQAVVSAERIDEIVGETYNVDVTGEGQIVTDGFTGLTGRRYIDNDLYVPLDTLIDDILHRFGGANDR